MDNDNLYKSFNGLLNDENEGWIITKNEGGKLKIASCPEDETNIYEKTRDWIVLTTDETKVSLKLPKCESLKAPNFFIRDLLNAHWEDGYFVIRNISFIQVYISGTVVDQYEYGHKIFITVDDGTSNIRCIIEKDKLCLLKHGIEHEESIVGDQTDVISSATAMLRAACKFLEDSVPSGCYDLELGSIVNIFGKMGEYKDNRYIFIKNIVKEPKGTIKHCVYLDNLIHLYNNVYIS